MKPHFTRWFRGLQYVMRWLESQECCGPMAHTLLKFSKENIIALARRWNASRRIRGTLIFRLFLITKSDREPLVTGA